MVDEQDKSPEDDPLEDVDLDDADLDALLEEVDEETAKDKPASLSASSSKDSPSDDGDLLDDDDLFEVLDEGASSDPAADSLGDDVLGDGDDLDALLDDADDGGNFDELSDLLGDADKAASEIPDTVPDELIAELDDEGGTDGSDGTEELDLIDDGSAEDSDATDLLGDLDDGDASGDPLADADELIPAAEIEKPAEEKKAGKKSFPKKGLGKKAGGKKAGGKKPAREKLAPPAKAPRGKTLTFVCSECYTEISVAADYSEEGVTCPDCLHVGKKPDDNFLRTVSITKSGERKSVVVATIVGLLMVVCFLGLLCVRSAYLTPELGKEDLQTWTIVLASGGGLFSLIFIWLLWRFEGNRWEVYF